MKHNKSTEVLVVGAGLCGMITALLLLERGIPFELVDQEDERSRSDAPVTLPTETLQLMGELGLSAKIRAAGSTGKADEVTIPKTVLLEIFDLALKERGGTVLWNWRLVDFTVEKDRVQALIEKSAWEPMGYAIATEERMVVKTNTLYTKYLVGADGADSAVRRLLKDRKINSDGRVTVFEDSNHSGVKQAYETAVRIAGMLSRNAERSRDLRII